MLLCGFVTAYDNGNSQTPASNLSVTVDRMSPYSSETTLTPVATEPFHPMQADEPNHNQLVPERSVVIPTHCFFRRPDFV